MTQFLRAYVQNINSKSTLDEKQYVITNRHRCAYLSEADIQTDKSKPFHFRDDCRCVNILRCSKHTSQLNLRKKISHNGKSLRYSLIHLFVLHGISCNSLTADNSTKTPLVFQHQRISYIQSLVEYSQLTIHMAEVFVWMIFAIMSSIANSAGWNAAPISAVILPRGTSVRHN